MKITTVFLDLDNTLYDEQQFIRGGFEAIAKVLSVHYRIDKDKVFEQMVREQSFDNVLKDIGLYRSSHILDVLDIYRYHTPEIELYPDVLRFLRRMRQKNRRVGIITNGYPKVQQSKIRALNLDLLVDGVVYAESFGHQYAKPHPIAFMRLLDEFHALPEETMMIGDDPIADIQGAKNVGIHAKLIRRKQHD